MKVLRVFCDVCKEERKTKQYFSCKKIRDLEPYTIHDICDKCSKELKKDHILSSWGHKDSFSYALDYEKC